MLPASPISTWKFSIRSHQVGSVVFPDDKTVCGRQTWLSEYGPVGRERLWTLVDSRDGVKSHLDSYALQENRDRSKLLFIQQDNASSEPVIITIPSRRRARRIGPS